MTATATRRAYGTGLAVASLAAVLVVLREIDALAARVPTASGRGWSLSELTTPSLALGRVQGWWSDVINRPEDDLLGRIGAFYVGADLLFMITYGLLLWRWSRGLEQRWRRTVRIATTALLAVDVVEDTLLVIAVQPGASPGWAAVLPVVSLAKGLAVAVIVVVVAIRVGQAWIWPPGDAPTPPVRRWLAEAYAALRAQRLLLVPVLLLGVLSVLSGSAILDQLPDVERQWIFDGGRGVRHALLSFAALALLALSSWAIGRLNARRRERARGSATSPGTPTPPPDDETRPVPWFGWRDPQLPGQPPRSSLFAWFLVPGISLVWLITALAWGGPIQGRRFAVFMTIFTGLWLSSFLLRHRWDTHRSWRYRPPTETAQPDQVRLAGDLLSLSVLTIGGLGLLRSFVPLLVVVRGGLTGSQPVGAVLLVLLGAAVSVVPWQWAARRGMGDPGLDRWFDRYGHRLPWVALALLAVLLAIGIAPAPAGRFLGVAAATVVVVGLLVGITGFASAALETTPELLRLLGFRSTPGVTILVVVLVAVGALSGTGTIHAIRSAGRAEQVADRPTLEAAFDAWLAADGCDRPLPGSATVRVRPMLLVAAEGGGVRAAYWTVRGLTEIGRVGSGCGARSTLLSGGASGGSVGLTVARFSGDPVAAVTALAGPDTLSAAVIGTFARDIAYGATGLPWPAAGDARWREWQDRARLIENGWEASAPADAWGSRPFLTAPSELLPGPGALVINSTSIKNNCRAWVSQLELPRTVAAAAPAPEGERSCDVGQPVGPRSVDVLSSYARTTDDPNQARCLGEIRASTAALLTARFPYVTPSGNVGPCPAPEFRAPQPASYWPSAQLVDGGYVENSGLATITDLAPQWLELVRRHNAATVRAGSGPLVVPVVVYLSNGSGQLGRAAQTTKPTNELVLPPISYLRGLGALNDPRAYLERARLQTAADSVCPAAVSGPEPTCARAVDSLRQRVIVVDRAVRPEISAPLGWVLSSASRTALDDAMADQLASGCPTASGARSADPDCARGLGRLADLVAILTGR